ncbi:Mitochondrial intermediate peptidase [Dirofilaria immitis]|nr:Mitochondrial intermediate peptidase [Dirofilaria immitis]
MGHAMHSMLARTQYQHVAVQNPLGTRCSTDMAEVPSNLMEYFFNNIDVLREIAKDSHGRPISVEDAASLITSRFAFTSLEMLQQAVYSLFDLEAHGGNAEGIMNGRISTADLYASIWSVVFPNVKKESNSAWHHRFTHLVPYGAKYYSYLVARAAASLIWNTRFRDCPFSRENGLAWGKVSVIGVIKGGSLASADLLNSALGYWPTVQNLAAALKEEADQTCQRSAKFTVATVCIVNENTLEGEEKNIISYSMTSYDQKSCPSDLIIDYSSGIIRLHVSVMIEIVFNLPDQWCLCELDTEYDSKHGKVGRSRLARGLNSREDKPDINCLNLSLADQPIEYVVSLHIIPLYSYLLPMRDTIAKRSTSRKRERVCHRNAPFRTQQIKVNGEMTCCRSDNDFGVRQFGQSNSTQFDNSNFKDSSTVVGFKSLSTTENEYANLNNILLSLRRSIIKISQKLSSSLSSSSSSSSSLSSSSSSSLSSSSSSSSST